KSAVTGFIERAITKKAAIRNPMDARRKERRDHFRTNGVSPKLMTAPSTKFVPVTFRTMVEPVAPDIGSIDVTAGTGLTTVSDAGGDDPPPGPGLITTTDAEPARRFAGTANVSVNGLTNVEVTVVPLTVSCDVVRNPTPLTVMRSPGKAVEGTSVVMAGVG